MQSTSLPPATLIQQQLDAYNAKNVEAWLACYAPNAQQYTLHGELLAQGHEDMRKRISTRFTEVDLHARLLNRTVMANIVIDLELITRNFPEGKGSIEMLCIYEIVNGLIQTASFSLGEKKLHG